MAGQTPKTVLTKMLRCQQIIGYSFRDISLLQESLTTGKNRRLAIAGDTYVQAALVDRWYLIEKSTPFDFHTIRRETVSNNNLARVGFRRGLNTCTLPYALSPVSTHFGLMADTIEALLAAVYRDSLFENGERNEKAVNWKAFEGVLSRLGLNHRLIASESDLRWSLGPMKTTRTLMRQFFSAGHHLELAKLVANTRSELPSLNLDDSPREVPSSVPDVKRPQGKGRTIVWRIPLDVRRHPQRFQSDDSMKHEQASKNKKTNKTSEISQRQPQASERKPKKIVHLTPGQIRAFVLMRQRKAKEKRKRKAQKSAKLNHSPVKRQ